MPTHALAITGMTCGHCVQHVRRALAAVPGAEVRHVEIGRAEVEAAADVPLETLLDAVRDEGYDAFPADDAPPPAPPLTALGRAPRPAHD